MRLADAMMLVAATAIGAAIIRDNRWNPTTVLTHMGAIRLPEYQPWAKGWIKVGASQLGRNLNVLLLAWTIAVLLMTAVRNPRSYRDHACRPGFAACLAVATVLIISPIAAIVKHFFDRPLWSVRFNRTLLCNFLQYWSVPMSCGVLTVWACLWLTGNWRRDETYLDQLGRLLGTAWIVVLPLNIDATRF
jgi:hypothetical protein